MDTIVYYISSSTIDQLYRKWIGHVTEETEQTEAKENQQRISADFGLSKLISLLSSSVRATKQKKITGSERKKMMMHVDERASSIVTYLETNSPLPDISDFRESSKCMFYRFNLSFEISEKFKRKGDGTIIELKANPPDFFISGTTSVENWTSASILNTLLDSGFDSKFRATGVLTPLNRVESNGETVVLVQYLVLCQSFSENE